MYNKLVKKIIFPVYLAKNKNKLLDRSSLMEKSQWLPPKDIVALQQERLKKLLIHSYKNVSLYKKKFDEVSFNPENSYSIEDFRNIPYLTKDEIQKYKMEMVAKNYKLDELIEDSSGGSTGIPTNFYKDKNRWVLRDADKIRHDRWAGWDIGEKTALLWGAPRDIQSHNSLKDKIVEKYIYRLYPFNAFDINEDKINNYLTEITKINPVIIVAYANVAYLFAKYIEKRKINTNSLRLKGIITSAETLTKEKRECIERVFNCKVFNRYGSRELGLIASECEKHNGMHINAENVIVEIEKNGKPVKAGEIGEVIVTDLWNYGMPFIRYRTGDVARQLDSELCACGRGLPLISDVEGRVSDFIVDSAGGLIHGEYFSHLIYGMNGIKQFQLVQEAREKLVLKLFVDKTYDKSLSEKIKKGISEVIGANISIYILYENNPIPIEKSGKYRFAVSHVADNIF